ncbi:MAG: hypothetical protein JW795_18840, partial [Chitinivibrionales bacterium]|nr:hypothetical protein [Chitinivibrionales bacterium]
PPDSVFTGSFANELLAAGLWLDTHFTTTMDTVAFNEIVRIDSTAMQIAQPICGITRIMVE